MQLDIAAIKDGFPEGVWLNAVFGFRLERRYLTVVFQGDDDFLLAKVYMHETLSNAIPKSACKAGVPWRQWKISI